MTLLLAFLLSQTAVTNKTPDKAIAVRCVAPDGGGFESCGGTNTQGVGIDGGGAWNVGGTVAVSNFPASQAVTGTLSVNTHAVTQGTGADGGGTGWNVTGQVAVTNLPATQPVSGTVAATQGTGEDGGRAWNVAGAVAVSNFPASQAVTGTFWQATQPVSIASMPSTPVTGAFFQATQPVSLASAPTTPVTGTLGATQGTAADGGVDWAVRVANTPAVTTTNVLYVYPVAPPLNPFLPRCNAVRRTNCQP